MEEGGTCLSADDSPTPLSIQRGEKLDCQGLVCLETPVLAYSCAEGEEGARAVGFPLPPPAALGMPMQKGPSASARICGGGWLSWH